MTYEKLFSIEFNNKKFMIFLDRNNRRTFLEINEKGEFEYCMLEDYLALYNIFNMPNPYVVYSISEFNFKQCVKVVKKGVLSLLSVITIINSMPNALAMEANVEVTDDSVTISEASPSNKKEYILIKDTNDLDKYLGHVDVTREIILDAINNNEKLPENIKTIAVEEFEEIYGAHPNANYRIFYENMKTKPLEAIFYSKEEYYKRFPKGSSASYDSKTNTIHLMENAPKDIVRHELAHTYHSFYREEADIIIRKSENHSALHEGMIDSMAKSDSSPSYIISKNVLKFLMYIADFTYEEYSRFGLENLISKAEKLYPGIRFRYVSYTLNTMQSAEISGKVTIKEAPLDMYNELFKACLQKASKTSGYEPFNKFLCIFNDRKESPEIKEYFQKYNEKLKELGYNPEIIKTAEANFKIYEKANCVIYNSNDESSLAFGYEEMDYSLYKANADDSLSQVNADDTFSYDSFIPKNFDLFKLKVLTNNSDLKVGITNVLKEEGMISPHKYSAIPICIDGKVLTTAMTGNLNIQVGFTENNKIGFIISDRDEKVIYKTNENLTNLSNKVPLNDYLWSHSYYIEELELRDILNEAYIKKYQSEYLGFYNFGVVENKIVMEPSTIITIIGTTDGKEYHQNYKVSDCRIYVQDDYILVRNVDYEYAKADDCIIDLESILKFANILVDGVPYYSITMNELTSITENYIAALNDEANVTKSGSDYYSYSTKITRE
ncbi:MAG: hypothetical protein K2M17_01340 [Bacilli bacterium]|nr:hypothetical protein [Bacilli bacterium]